MKRPGEEEPAFAQMMSGGVELFHVVVSSRMRVFSVAEVQSALMARKRWFGDLECDCCRGVQVSIWWEEGGKEREEKYLDVVDGFIELLLVSCDNADIRALFG